jgi:transposase
MPTKSHFSPCRRNPASSPSRESRRRLNGSAPKTRRKSSVSSRNCATMTRPWRRQQHYYSTQKRSRSSGERTRRTDLARRPQKALQIMDERVAAGARARQLALLLGIGLTTLQRWRRQFADDGGVDRRKGSQRHVAHRLSAEERQRILLTCKEPEFAGLPPGQILPILADRDRYIGSKSSFYRVLDAHGQAHRRGRARPPQERRSVPRLKAPGPNQVWRWDITYLHTTVRGVWK